MQFKDILGHDHVKNHLIKNADSGRIPHAQLFIGPEGSGTLAMAIAYARYVICNNAQESCHLKFDALAHPDLHFIYPTVTTDEVKTKPKSTDFLADWRAFLKENPYANLFEWYKRLGFLNKQGEIRVDDAQEALKTLSLKSFENGYKIMIIWQADKMNVATANKLLKIIEEPPQKTLFILITENEQSIIQTIKSRCQAIHFGPLPDQVIKEALITHNNLNEKQAAIIAHQAQGNYFKAIQLLTQEEEYPFEQWFVEWVRTAFRAKGNPSSIQGLISWSETLAGLGREAQKKFLNYCIDMFRQALLLNYNAKELVYIETSFENFKLEKFAPFVHGNNINDIFNELSNAIYHIERNGNAKMILTDLSIKLTRLIHKK